jgi:hypothetical protein
LSNTAEARGGHRGHHGHHGHYGGHGGHGHHGRHGGFYGSSVSFYSGYPSYGYGGPSCYSAPAPYYPTYYAAPRSGISFTFGF